jgi:hypothetical protein
VERRFLIDDSSPSRSDISLDVLHRTEKKFNFQNNTPPRKNNKVVRGKRSHMQNANAPIPTRNEIT